MLHSKRWTICVGRWAVSPVVLVRPRSSVVPPSKTNRAANRGAMPDDQPFEVRSIDGLDALFEELEQHCHSTAIVTVNGALAEPFTFDLKRTTDDVEYGYERSHHSSIQARTLRLIAEGGAAITIRSFTDRSHPDTDLPYKELRAYRARVADDRIAFEQLPAEEVFTAYTVDAHTGEAIDAEPEAIYCGPESRIRGEER